MARAARLRPEVFGVCRGPSEWAHFGDEQRFRTRGRPPEARHTPEGSLMLCERHHDDYDEHRLAIEALDAAARCAGDLAFARDGVRWSEREAA